jgi:4-amino-4-deoxy-L-arabinose transferase-like glycosyltransferase
MILSWFFRVFGERYIPFMLLQALLGALTAAMTAWLGYRALGKEVALLTGILVALNTELISFTRMMLTETIFAFLLAATALFFMELLVKGRIIHGIAVGLLVGSAALCRPVVAVWVILIIVAVFLTKRALKTRIITALLISGLALLVVSPWIIRNQRSMGSAVFSTSGGITFWLWGHNSAAPADENTVIPHEFEEANRESGMREFFSTGNGNPVDIIPVFNMQPRYQAFFYEQRVIDRLSGLDEVAADRELTDMAIEYIKAHPLATLRHSLTDLLRTLAWTEMNGRMNIVLTLTMPFLLLGSFMLAGKSREAAFVVFSCIASMLAVHFIFYFDHRFRVPYQPFLMLLGAAGFHRAIQGNLSPREKFLLYGFMVVPVAVNYFLIWGSQSG